ncbi:hypothetical protein [Flavobacterium sp.]|uniref:hypothetical protein n=1 Tax=Flavobacterium sp. TaxID=239 RepID=UPI003D6A6BC3
MHVKITPLNSNTGLLRLSATFGSSPKSTIFNRKKLLLVDDKINFHHTIDHATESNSELHYQKNQSYG